MGSVAPDGPEDLAQSATTEARLVDELRIDGDLVPDQQRGGVGAALLHATLAATDALGLRGVVLLGHPTYYPRFGFAPAADHGVTPPADWGREYFMLRRLEAWGDGPGGAFRYAPAFERLED